MLAANSGKRFGAIHGLRGIAAISVVFYHLTGNVSSELEELLPEFILKFVSFGYLGVPVFFVISGFVISYSIGSDKVSGGYVGKFILRRSVRLDLTYWLSIGLALSLITIKNQVLGFDQELPSITDVVLHMFYLQDLLGVEPVISVVYWTLCLEVQFYLVYILLFWLTQSISFSNNTLIFSVLIISIGVYSLLLDLAVIEVGIQGLFLSSWHYFLMGVLVCGVLRGVLLYNWIFFAWLVFEVFLQDLFSYRAYNISGILCSLLIFILWKLNSLDRLLTGRILTYLGTISYTLYLVHPDIGWKVISVGKLLLGGPLSAWMAIILLFSGIAASICMAHVFHVLVERPTQKISARLKDESLLFILKEKLMFKS